MFDKEAVATKAAEMHIEDVSSKDHWLLVSALFDDHAEKSIQPEHPTFVTDFPSAISP